jgi:DNA-binding NarL/FixJ family response regulator
MARAVRSSVRRRAATAPDRRAPDEVSVLEAAYALRGSETAWLEDAWRGLVAGRWSLVDHVDRDGKRFLVARKNDPDAPEASGLTLRERQVLAARARGLSLKLIAYDLGLSIAAVGKSLQVGMAKLGVSSDAELPPLFSPRPQP